MSLLVKLVNVSKKYHVDDHYFEALRSINLEIKRGEKIAIIGSSGSGKSTLMNILGCLDYCSSGQYFLDGQDVSLLNSNELAYIRNRKLGFIFQSFFLLPRLSALDNIILPLFYQGVDKKSAIKQGMDLLDKLNIVNVATHRPNQLSGGQQQRVAIARALITNPDLILADEPTGALDTKTGEEIMALLNHLNEQENKTIIMITHDLNLSKYFKRVITISDGQLT